MSYNIVYVHFNSDTSVMFDCIVVSNHFNLVKVVTQSVLITCKINSTKHYLYGIQVHLMIY